MGRDKGTNVYSNNFEPQVMGLLDARTRVDTKADLTKTATWTSADGNTYVPVGIRVSVTDDSTNGNNGVYMLMGEEYTIASNWMQINGSSGGSSEKPVYVVDSSKLSFISIQTGDILTQEQYDELVTIVFSIFNKVVIVSESYNNSNYSFISSILNFRAAEDGSTHLTLYNKDGKLCDYSINTNTDSPVGKSTWTVSLPEESSTYNIPSDVLNFTNIKNRQNKSCTSEEYYVVMELMNNIMLNIPVRYHYVNEAEEIMVNSFVNMSITMDGEDPFISFSLLNGKTLEVYSLRIVGNSSVVSDYIWEIASTESNIEIIDLSEIAAVNDKNITASASLKAEIEKLYDVVTSTNIPFANYFDNIEGKYPISIKDVSSTNTTFTVLFYNELWEVDYNRNTSTYSTTKVEYGQGGGSTSSAEIIELPIEAANNFPYENGSYEGSNLAFCNKIREITSPNNISKYYKLKSPSGAYFDIINPYQISSYAGFYLLDSEGSDTHIHTSITTGDSTYWMFNEGSYYMKQDTLVSGTNIKTINGNSILGSGNLQIAGGSGSNIEIVDLTTLTLEEVTTFTDASSVINAELRKVAVAMTSGTGVIVRSIYKGYETYACGTVEDQRYLYLEFDSSNGTRWRITIRGISSSGVVGYKMADISRKHDLSLDVRILNNKIQYRIHEVAPNGYICFYRKKRCKNSKIDRPHVNKYTIPYFYFSSMIPTLGVYAIKKKYMISASEEQLNVWTDFPMEVLENFATGTLDEKKFTGTVHAKPCSLDSATGLWNKHLAVLNMGLAYNIVNSNFIKGIKEEGAYPTDILQAGNMVKFKCRLNVISSGGYELRYTMF